MNLFRPHDLLWINDSVSLLTSDPLPSWATPQWLAVAPVVVRREAVAEPALVPVGLRGTSRSERCAAYMPTSEVRRMVTPEGIAQARAWHAHPDSNRLPALQALARLAPLLDRSGFAWGVTGGAGFALAAGLDVLRPDSDLDLLIRAPSRPDAKAVNALAMSFECAGARIDVQIETMSGAFALKEWLRTGGPVLLKTSRGPMLTADPWGQLRMSGSAGDA